MLTPSWSQVKLPLWLLHISVVFYSDLSNPALTLSPLHRSCPMLHPQQISPPFSPCNFKLDTLCYPVVPIIPPIVMLFEIHTQFVPFPIQILSPNLCLSNANPLGKVWNEGKNFMNGKVPAWLQCYHHLLEILERNFPAYHYRGGERPCIKSPY